jgi:hypothetical protein
MKPRICRLSSSIISLFFARSFMKNNLIIDDKFHVEVVMHVKAIFFAGTDR